MTGRRLGLFSLASGGLVALSAVTYGALTGGLASPLPDEPARPGSVYAREIRDRAHQIDVWERAASQDTSSALALAQLAGLYLQRGRETGDFTYVVRSEAVARRSLAIRTNRNARTFSTLVASLVAQHRFAEALPIAAQMAAMDPDVPTYRSLLGEIQMEVGDYAAARASFDAVRGATELPAVAARLARWYEVSGRDEEARRLLNETLLAMLERVDLPAEQIAWFFLRLGEHDLRLGRISDARAAFRLGLERAPGDHRLLGALARLEAARHRWTAAVELGERAIVSTLDPATLGILADAYAARGDSAKASDMARALEVSVLSQPGAFHRAWSLYLLDHGRRVAGVAGEVEKELETRQDIYAYDLLAWTRYRQGRSSDAAAASRRALSLGTRDPMLHYHAGMIERSLGHTRQARQLLARALEVNPRFHHAHADTARAVLEALGGAERRR